MAQQFTPAMSGPVAPEAQRSSQERRRHKRVLLTLLGRFMRANKQEYPCKLVDISVGGAAMMSPVAVEPGERIVAYFDHVGGLEGHVVRTFEGGFALALVATQHKREKLAAQLTWLINRTETGSTFERQHERLAPAEAPSTLKLADDIVVPCEILDISVSGAMLKTEARPEIGREVVVGKLRGRVMRHHPTGIGVRFLDIQKPAALRRHFR
jgi:hypothetical protein